MPIYNRGMFALITGGGSVNFITGDIRVLLVDSSHTFDPDDNFVSDLVADEISTTNYARQELASQTITENDTSNRVIFDAADFSISALGPATSGPTIGGAVVYEFNASDGAATLLAFVDLVDTQVNGSDFTISWLAADGVFYYDSPS